MADPVDRGDIGEIKQSTTHVEAYVEISRDAGSIPAASTRLDEWASRRQNRAALFVGFRRIWDRALL